MSPPPRVSWLSAVGRRLGGPAEIVGRAPLSGGYASGGVERVDLVVDGREVSVVVKRAEPVEVAALRAVGVVDGARVPRLLAPEPLVVGWVEGASTGEVSTEVLRTLARVHRHWARNRPRGIPVVDAAWWTALCERTVTALRGGAARTGEPVYGEAAALVGGWAGDARIREALAVLPRTLCHGDPHRGNLLGDTVIDWGNARVAPAGLDLAVLRAQGPVDLGAYRAELPEGPLEAVEREWARAHVHIQYLGFAADHLGADRVAEMVGETAAALSRLGPALRARRG
ncbi:phosphotransferase [Pseudonocardia xishanensis]|uniref:Aminoglycoside phosphotransferase domain-containing protein n=1 Tax=Pseudonocardia xishanensis TaxID=630995 RepID=A0ABP8RZY2_9PSEU